MGLKVAIAGGGASHTPGIILTLLNHKEFPVDEIRLYDNDSVQNDDMYLIVKTILAKKKLDVALIKTEDPAVAFSGIDYIFSQLRVGKMQMREKDEKIPLAHDVVGQETCGLGGFAYGLRSMKGFVELIGYVQQYAPNAWVLNYTNPESIIAECVRRAYPKAKIINACDMTIAIEELLCKSFGYNRDNWVPVYYGLNHFGWYHSIYDIELKRDVMPEIIQKMQTQGVNTEGMEPSWAHTYNNMCMITKHFPNNIPNNYLQYYLYPNRMVAESDKNYTRANEIMDGRLKTIKEAVRAIKAGDPDAADGFASTEHGKYIVDIAASILHNKNDRFMLIVPNKGAIPNLRQDAVVEVPCHVNATGAEPVSLRFDIPDFHKGIMEAQVAAEKMLVDAFFEQSYQKAFEAFALNQTIPNADVAKTVLDELLVANKDFWVNLH